MFISCSRLMDPLTVDLRNLNALAKVSSTDYFIIFLSFERLLFIFQQIILINFAFLGYNSGR